MVALTDTQEVLRDAYMESIQSYTRGLIGLAEGMILNDFEFAGYLVKDAANYLMDISSQDFEMEMIEEGENVDSE